MLDQRAEVVGRDAERAALAALIDRARAGAGGWTLIEGEAGVGKTRLLEEAFAYAEPLGLAIVGAACDELDRDRPFGALLDGLAGTGTRLDTGTDADSQGGPAGRYTMIESILQTIERLCMRDPTLIAVEDLHWADDSTLHAFHHLCKGAAHLPVAVIGTLRPDTRTGTLARIADAARDLGTHVLLTPLHAEAADELVQRSLGARPGPHLASMLQAAGGNPFLITETIAALADTASITVADGVADVSASEMPASLLDSVRRRMRLLSDESLDALRVAATLGSTFDLTDVATVRAIAPAATAAELEPAIRRGILTHAGERLAFRHDLVREAILQDMGPPVRSALHLQAARALAAADAPVEQVAAHFALGARPGDRDAIDWLRRAAAATCARAPSIAVGSLERATELAAADQALVREIRFDLARFLLWAGRSSDAERMAADAYDTDRDATLLALLAPALYLRGRWEDSARALETALADATLDDVSRCHALAHAAFATAACGRFDEAHALAAEAMAHGERLGLALPRSIALAGDSWAWFQRGHIAEALASSEQAMTLERDDTTGEVRVFSPGFHYAQQCAATDRIEEAERVLRAGRRAAEERGAVWVLPLYHTGLASVRWRTGEWDDALVEAATAVELGEESDTTTGFVMCRAIAADIALHRGDIAGARQLVDEAGAFIAAVGRAQFGVAHAMRAAALVAEAAGDIAGAAGLLGLVWDEVAAMQARALMVQLGPDLARLATLAGSQERAIAVADAMDEVAAVMQTRSADSAALRTRGLATGHAQPLLDAARALEGMPVPVERATLLAEAGERTPGAAGTALLEESLAAFEAAGANRDIAQVEAALRARGVRRGARGSRRRETTGWGSLTASEREVVALAAQGLTNPEIGQRLYISRRTVQRHLSNVFLKLGITSRVQLAAEASRHQR